MSNRADITTSTFYQGNAGNITINSQSSNQPLIIESRGTISSQTFGQGNAGNILINALSPNEALIIKSGGSISAETYSKGNAGQIVIKAKGTILVDGGLSDNQGKFSSSSILSSTFTPMGGNGGDIQIAARSLTVSNGGSIDSGTSSRGNGGNILINTQDSVNIIGQTSVNDSRGEIFIYSSKISSNLFDAVTRAQDGKFVTVSLADVTRRGGSIKIETGNFNLSDGAFITTTTASRGNSGDIDIMARDRITISGGSGTENISRIGSIVFAGDLLGFKFQGVGKAGDIRLSSQDLFLSNGIVSASSKSSAGIAADVTINASRIKLDNTKIKTESILGDGGNLTFNARDYLLLRNDSQISTSAGNEKTGGNGGSIRISAPVVVAIPKENSDITANAFSGSGGRVNIQTNALIGITPSAKLTPLSDITASSEQGVQGTIAITQPDTSPEQGLTQLPGNILDASDQINQNCSNAGKTRSMGAFVVSGRGSLPTSPLDPLADNPNLPGLAELKPEDRSIAQTTPMAVVQVAPTIVEAQGWQKTRDGKVILLAQPPIVSTPTMMSETASAPNGFACVAAHRK